MNEISERCVKGYFQPWCNVCLDPISCNMKFPDYWKPSKLVFLKSHPGHIVKCFTINTFAVHHFTVSLQYFEFCLVESEENVFLSITHAWISWYSVNRGSKKDNFPIFLLSRSAWGFLIKIIYFPIGISIFKFSKCHAWISSYSVYRVCKADNVWIFPLSRSPWGL